MKIIVVQWQVEAAYDVYVICSASLEIFNEAVFRFD